MLSIMTMSKHIVRYLLDKDVNVNQQNTEDISPLHAAVSKGSLNLVNLVVDGGADVILHDIHHTTPLYVALEYKNKYLSEYLAVRSSSCSVSLNIALEIAIWTNLWDLIPCLLKNDANVNAQNMRGLMAMHRAAGLGEFDVSVNLLDTHADVNRKYFYEIAPLSVLLSVGISAWCSFLTLEGCYVHHQDTAGSTVLHCAFSFENVYIIYLVTYCFLTMLLMFFG